MFHYCWLAAESVFIRLFEDAVIDLLQDERLKDCIDYEAKPIFMKGTRVFGPFRSGTFWQQTELQFKGRTVICIMVYSDATELYKGVSAHPVFSMCPSHVLCV